MIKLDKKRRLFTASRDEPVTEKLIEEAIKLHRTLVPDYQACEDLYLSDHAILRAEAKETYKPDNRLVVNYAKYIVDTFVGYQLGIPVKISHEDSSVSDFVANFRKVNDSEDSEFELAKTSSIFGHAFAYLYQDEAGLTRLTYDNPLNMFIVHDDTVQARPLFAVRYALGDDKGEASGEVITATERYDMLVDSAGFVVLGDPENHVFGGLPVIELIENEERQAVFEAVKTLVNALDKVFSEKANDVDYFADAYLKVIGVELDDESKVDFRDSRIFNAWSHDGKPIEIAFLEKPNADTTQENLIERLVKFIFDISMVANLSDEDFGNSSGTALAFKLQPMSNLALIKDRKMQSAFNRLYEQVFSVPMAGVPVDAWLGLEYRFTRNVPRNLLEEAQIAQALDGQVSDETKLAVLSIVDNPSDELDKIAKEEQQKPGLSQLISPGFGEVAHEHDERYAD